MISNVTRLGQAVQYTWPFYWSITISDCSIRVYQSLWELDDTCLPMPMFAYTASMMPSLCISAQEMCTFLHTFFRNYYKRWPSDKANHTCENML